MDKKLGNNIVVGIFVLAGFSTLVFVLFSMGNGRGFLSGQFTLKTRFIHVKGLHYGSEVALSGLRIGTIKDIEIAADDTKELVVTLAIDKGQRFRLRTDSRAFIRTQGVLGDKYIELTIGSSSAEALKDGDLIPSQETQDIIAKSGTLVEGIGKHFEKGGDFEALMSRLNLLSENLVTLTSDIRNKKGIANEMIYGNSGSKLSQSMEHLESILRKINDGQGTLGAVINDPTLYEDVKYMMGGAKRSSVLKYFMRSFIEDGEKTAPANETKKN